MTLIVAGQSDWRKLCSYPYGLPFTRNGPGGTSAAIMAAADYQPRFVRRFDEMLLEAGRAGHRAPAHIGEFLDLMVGHEWGHAVGNLSGMRTRVRWLDELLASYLFVAALHATRQAHMLERLTAWTELQVAGTAGYRGDLADFEYPRSRAGWNKLLWYQGVFTQRALELVPARGWSFPLELRAALPADPDGTITHTARGCGSCRTSDSSDSAPTPPSSASWATSSGERSKPTTSCPSLSRRPASPLPMRPSPISPSRIIPP